MFVLALVKLILEVGPSPSTKRSFLQLSVWDDELLSTPKFITLLAKSLSKLYERTTSNAIP